MAAKLSLNPLQLTRLENFGHSIQRPAYLFRPTHPEQLEEIFELANREGINIALRGAGRSYGDAALASGGIVLDMQRMNRILDWNPETGEITVEPGVTIERLWRYIMEDGWWSPVMPGTMFPTIGGCLGANVHGKNNWKTGTLGEHVVSFTALLPNGKKVTCTPKKNKVLFYGIISGMGLLGVFTSITLQMKKIYSGNLEVKAWAEPNLTRMLKATDDFKEEDYIVGWVDSTARGRGRGRGQMHSARYLEPGEDPNPVQSLFPGSQDLPDTIMGLVPKSIRGQILGISLVLGIASYSAAMATRVVNPPLTPQFVFGAVKDGFVWAAAFPMFARAFGMRDPTDPTPAPVAPGPVAAPEAEDGV